MNPTIKLVDTAAALARTLASDFQHATNQIAKIDHQLFVALSGGTTPKLFFQILTKPLFQKRIKWNKVHLFWGDERCVPPEDSESNYEMTKKNLLDHISIPPGNIHRIRGELNPQQEATRYAREIEDCVPGNNEGFPQFDWIFFGMGTDGHTASIFPGSDILYEDKNICAVATHPNTGQKRITLTLPVINNAKRISFLVTGESKALLAATILDELRETQFLPAALVKPEDGILEWRLDREAGALLKCTEK